MSNLQGWHAVAREIGDYDIQSRCYEDCSARMDRRDPDWPIGDWLPAEAAAKEILRLREQLAAVKASLRDEMLPKIQALRDWIGKHWANRDWGCEAEKLHESCDLLHEIAACVGLDISTGSRVKVAAERQQETTDG